MSFKRRGYLVFDGYVYSNSVPQRSQGEENRFAKFPRDKLGKWKTDAYGWSCQQYVLLIIFNRMIQSHTVHALLAQNLQFPLKQEMLVMIHILKYSVLFIIKLD